jgi:hypothetical protein
VVASLDFVGEAQYVCVHLGSLSKATTPMLLTPFLNPPAPTHISAWDYVLRSEHEGRRMDKQNLVLEWLS